MRITVNGDEFKVIFYIDMFAIFYYPYLYMIWCLAPLH